MTSPLQYHAARSAMYYEPPRRFEPLRLAISFPLVTALSVLIAAGYIFAWTTFPSLYVRVGSAAGTGVAIGLATAKAIQFSRVSSILPALFLALAVSAVTWYCSWLFWLYHILQKLNHPMTLKSLLISPLLQIRLILAIGRIGVWSYQGNIFRGPLLFIIWLVEAGMIFTIPAWIAVKATSNVAPICRTCGRQCVRRSPAPRLAGFRASEVPALVEAKNFDALLEIGPLLDDNDPQIDFELYSCRDCGDEHVLSVHRTELVRDRSGKIGVKSATLVKRLMLTRDEAEQLLALRPKLLAMQSPPSPIEEPSAEPAAPEPDA